MNMLQRWIEAGRQRLFPANTLNVIPPLDGALSPNNKLETFEVAFPEHRDVEDLVAGADEIFVSDANRVFHRTGKEFEETRLAAEFGARVGALALGRDGVVLAAIDGEGLAAIDRVGQVTWLREAGGRRISCITSIDVGDDGAILICEGSARHAQADWVRDLMEKGSTGRLILCDPELRNPVVLLGGLRYPHAAFASGGSDIWLGESWATSVDRYHLSGGQATKSGTIMETLPGYPGRMTRRPAGGFLLPLFALRTQLVELVLNDDHFRKQMLCTIDDASLWIAPQYRSGTSFLEPLQGGGMKKLGIVKPWAPPRSYGFVGLTDGDGIFTESLQSRADGTRHGIVRAVETSWGLFAVSKGLGCVLHRAKVDDR